MNTFLKNVKAKRPFISKSKKNQRVDERSLLLSPRSHDEFDEGTTSPVNLNDCVDEHSVVTALKLPDSAPDSSNDSLRPVRLGSFNFDNPVGSRCEGITRQVTFPTLFEEAASMLQLCNLICVLLEVSKLARHGAFEQSDIILPFLKVPLLLDTITRICVEEADVLRTMFDRHGTAWNALECALRYCQKQRDRENQDSSTTTTKQKVDETDDGIFGWMGCGLSSTFSFDELTDALTNTFCGGDLRAVDCSGQKTGYDGINNNHYDELDLARIIATGDSGDSEEMAYVMELNRAKERITVIFKGPRTKADSVADSVLAPDPRQFQQGINLNDDSHIKVGVHRGFYNSFLGEVGDKPCKYMEIMIIVERLLAETPTRRNYKLYSTGHGSGGALATLFGFYAAGSSTIVPLPVTVVSMASPRVGNIAFARAFADMESQGKLRHLRIVNHGDPVPLGPIGFEQTTLAVTTEKNGQSGEEEASYHTGIEMRLFKNVSASSSHRVDLTYSGSDVISRTEKSPLTVIGNGNSEEIACHYSTAYSDRLAYVESDLEGLTLNAVYRKKACGITS